MPEQRIVGRVRGKDIAPDNFQDALDKLVSERLENLAAGKRETGFVSVSRFGTYGMLVRLYETLEQLTNAIERGRGTPEYFAGVLLEQAITFLAIERGVWELPLRDKLSAYEDEPEEHLREH